MHVLHFLVTAHYIALIIIELRSKISKINKRSGVPPKEMNDPRMQENIPPVLLSYSLIFLRSCGPGVALPF